MNHHILIARCFKKHHFPIQNREICCPLASTGVQAVQIGNSKGRFRTENFAEWALCVSVSVATGANEPIRSGHRPPSPAHFLTPLDELYATPTLHDEDRRALGEAHPQLEAAVVGGYFFSMK